MPCDMARVFPFRKCFQSEIGLPTLLNSISTLYHLPSSSIPPSKGTIPFFPARPCHRSIRTKSQKMAPPSRTATLDSPLFKCCHTLKTLGWTNDATALALLTRAANQVKPLMANRRWAVPLLEEFYPAQPNLLGLNHAQGAKIQLRLRSPSDKSTFLPYQSILGTLLHELAHIEVGPHNAAFYKLLDALTAECEQLIARGNDGTAAGASFSGSGKRVGLGAVANVPRHLANRTAVNAALKRRQVAGLMPSGGRRLGGETEIARLCDPREMALAAAVRRRGDEVWCGSAREGAGDADVILVEDEEEEDVVFVGETRVPKITQVPKETSTASRHSRGAAARVPVRRNAAAEAALRRAAQRH